MEGIVRRSKIKPAKERRHPDMQPSLFQSMQVLHLRRNMAAQLKNLPGILQKEFTCTRQQNTLPFAGKKRYAQIRFQPLDRLA